MARTPTTIRVSDSEKALLEAAARKRDKGWTTYMRDAGLDAAARDLAGDVPALRRRQERERDGD